MIKKAKKNKQFKVTPSQSIKKLIYREMSLVVTKDMMRKNPLDAKLLIDKLLHDKDREFNNDSLKKIRDICNEYIRE